MPVLLIPKHSAHLLQVIVGGVAADGLEGTGGIGFVDEFGLNLDEKR